jgi:hypothetical protein
MDLKAICLVTFTPLKIYNGTPDGRLNRDLRATLPINQLKGKPPRAVCPILNVHRCKPNEIYLDFFKNFIEYDIYIIIDDITFDSTELKLKYPTIDFIQIKNQDCLQSGFTNTSTITLQKPVVG